MAGLSRVAGHPARRLLTEPGGEKWLLAPYRRLERGDLARAPDCGVGPNFSLWRREASATGRARVECSGGSAAVSLPGVEPGGTYIHAARCTYHPANSEA